jgi:hypothetical protein
VTSFIRQLRLLLLGLWLGAAIFFGAAVAPALFDVLRGAGLENASELAGSIVTRLLAFINRSGLEVGLFVFVTGFFVHRGRSRLAQVAEMISVAIMAIMAGVNHWLIASRMAALRVSMGSIDTVAPADGRRIEFDSLHRYSVALLGLGLVAGLFAFLVASRAPEAAERKRD